MMETRLYFVKHDHPQGTHFFRVDVGEQNMLTVAVAGEYTDARGELIKKKFVEFLSLANDRVLTNGSEILPNGMKVSIGHA